MSGFTVKTHCYNAYDPVQIQNIKALRNLGHNVKRLLLRNSSDVLYIHCVTQHDISEF